MGTLAAKQSIYRCVLGIIESSLSLKESPSHSFWAGQCFPLYTSCRMALNKASAGLEYQEEAVKPSAILDTRIAMYIQE